MGEITFSIEKKLGVIETYATGWSKEINIVRWNGGTPKFDIRDWDAEHTRMCKGVTLHETEARKLYELLGEYFEK